MNARRIAYWTTTVLIALGFLIGAHPIAKAPA